MSDASADDLSLLQDVLDQVVNGRTEGHRCPFCHKGVLECSCDSDSGEVSVRCRSCGKFFEGRLA